MYSVDALFLWEFYTMGGFEILKNAQRHWCFCTHTDTHTRLHTKSSDHWTNKPVLSKDRIWPLGGGTRHFLPTSHSCCHTAIVCLCACVCVMWPVLCFLLNTGPFCATGSEGRGWAIKGQEFKQMRCIVCNKRLRYMKVFIALILFTNSWTVLWVLFTY